MKTTSGGVDWGEASESFDEILTFVSDRDLATANEAQTRYDVIDRIIREVLHWAHGQVAVEEPNEGERKGFVDYILRCGDHTIVVEAKRVEATFPSPTHRARLKLSGNVLGRGEIGAAIKQAQSYAETKQAEVVVVTNGPCWCVFSVRDARDDGSARMFFPFVVDGHAEQLYRLLSAEAVSSNSLLTLSIVESTPEDRLLSVARNADARIDRNNIADHIVPALNNALLAEALLRDSEHLERCFVSTEARQKFDATLNMYLADPKPEIIKPAKRIKKGMEHGHLEQVVSSSVPNFAPPVTLVIGPVGAGKSTYLKHFELVSGANVIRSKQAHWIYIDFEEMGKEGSPRQFIYRKLLDYLLAEHPDNPTDYKAVIEPAYAEDIAALARGPYAPIFTTNKPEFRAKVAEFIDADFKQVEPYVDKVFRYIAKSKLCIVVLDNVDLYEDEKLETVVFAEGLALSKRIFCNVMVSIRETTFVRHRADSTFDAYALNKLWLDPPPLREVLSTRLSYAKKILEGKSAQLTLANGIRLAVPDLSVFFDIVQRSILGDRAGDYIEGVSDLNIRKGLALVTNFLTSGHIQADHAIKIYIDGNHQYSFPFHEVFKGTMLGQWMHFREDRSDYGVNLFDARLGARRSRLLRMLMLNYLLINAQYEHTLEVPVADCVRIFSNIGASESQIVACMTFLSKRGLVRNIAAEDIDTHSAVVATKSGGYYSRILSRRFVYVEECMFDTAIEDAGVWQSMSELTSAIDSERQIPSRMELRRERIQAFLDYLVNLEQEAIDLVGMNSFACMNLIKESVLSEVNRAVIQSRRYFVGDKRLDEASDHSD